MSRHWAQLPERGTAFTLRLIRWIGMHVGRWAARLLLYPITLYFLLLAGPARRASRDYLGRVLDAKPRWWHIFKHIHCFSATILDRIYLLTGQFQRFDIRIHNAEVLLNQAEQGRGCLLLGSHLGSFEVLRVLGLARFPLKVLMNVDHNQVITAIMDALNPEIAKTIIPIRGPETLLKVKENLDQGCLIGTLGDRVVENNNTVTCQFLGSEAQFPAGPMLIACMMQCPVILFFGLYRGAKRYDIYFECLTECINIHRKQRQEAIRQWTQCYAARLEHYTHKAPYNWFNFYNFWDKP